MIKEANQKKKSLGGNKLKRKLLGICLTIALVTTLGLVTALPMASAASTYAGYTLGEASDTAVWSTTNTAPSGDYSAKLTHTANATAHAWVQLIPPAGISLAEFVAAPATYGFTYWRTEDKVGPLLEMRFTDGADALAEITLDMALYDYLSSASPLDPGQWIVKTASGTEQCMYYGEDSADVGLTGTGVLGDLSDLITDIAAGAAADDAAAVGAWEMTRVRVDLGWSADTQNSAWVDDVIIDGVTYDLEPFAPFDDHYRTGETLSVTVARGNANSDAMAIETITVSAVSTTDTTGDTSVTLTETGSDTGVFTGSITLVGAAPANRTNDEIVVADTDTVTITCSADWGAGSEVLTPTTIVDDSSPVITVASPTVSENITARKPLIKATYTDVGSGTDNTTAVMKVNDSVVAFSANTTAITYTSSDNLTDGTYAVTVDISDVAGNAATQKAWSFTVDNVAPVISQVATPAVVTPAVSSNITFTATVADATSGVASVTIDLSDAAIGGSATTPMLDGGVAPDATAGDGIYTAEITATIAEGTYLLAVTATDQSGNTVTTTGDDRIELIVSSDTTDPVISSPAIAYLYGLSSAPPGGVGGTVTISATVTDAGGMGTVTAACTTGFAATIDLLDDGNAPDADADDDVYTGTATVATGTSGNYTITIAAVDAKTNVATPNTSLTLTVAPDTGWDIDLVVGWNLISLPLMPTDGSIDLLLADISDNVTQVRTWVYESGVLTEKIWAEGGAVGTLDEMTDGCGYWIEMTQEITLTVTGVVLPPAPQAPPSYSVYEGWNFIGFKALSAYTAEVYLGGAVVLTFERMYGYDAAGDVYTVIQPTTPNLEPGQGYWLAVSADGTIYP